MLMLAKSGCTHGFTTVTHSAFVQEQLFYVYLIFVYMSDWYVVKYNKMLCLKRLAMTQS